MASKDVLESMNSIRKSKLVTLLSDQLELKGFDSKANAADVFKKASKELDSRVLFDIVRDVEKEVEVRIKGQAPMLRAITISLILNEHILLEGKPGVGKTEVVKWAGCLLGLPYSRVQFIPDMLPSDLIGRDNIDIVKLNNKQSDAVSWVNGPLFASIVLADEMNRAPSKVQAALLEGMGEGQITPFGKAARPLFCSLHHAAMDSVRQTAGLDARGLLGVPIQVLPEYRHRRLAPFVVLATMNPIEQEGVYPLAEAQMDRFMTKFIVPYPDRASYENIQDSVFNQSEADPCRSDHSFDECMAHFKDHPADAVFALLPLYFFLACRARLFPLCVGNQFIYPKSIYSRLRQAKVGSDEQRWLNWINDICYMTNARSERVGESGGASGWYDQEQLALREYVYRQGHEHLAPILTQEHTQYVRSGASPRGFLKLIPAAIAHAVLEGRYDKPTPADILAVINNVLRHRIHMDVRAQMAGVRSEDVLHHVCEAILSKP